MRRGSLIIGVIGLCVLLAGCGGAGSPGAGHTATPAATSTPTAAPSPTPNVIALNGNDTSGDLKTVCGGDLNFSYPSPQVAYKLSGALYVGVSWALPYPSYALPATLPVAPWALPADPGSPQLDQAMGGPANLNPSIGPQGGGILLTICNAGAQPMSVTDAEVVVASFTPVSGAVNAWNGCDGAFVRPQGPYGGGCGGAMTADELMVASFASSDGKYATAQAAQKGASGINGYSPLPATIKPGKTMSMLIGIQRPSAPGVYEFAANLITSVAGAASVASPFAPLPPETFAQVMHTFTGQACASSAMQTQIPAQATDPATYYICPQS